MVRLPLVGGCQCGALRYEVTHPPLMIYNCHCTNCQTIGGGAFGTPATVLEASFKFTKGELTYVLVLLSKEQPVKAPTVEWAVYYADYIAEHYTKAV